MVVGAIGREVLLCPEGSTSQIHLILILIIFPFSFKNNILVTLTSKFSFLPTAFSSILWHIWPPSLPLISSCHAWAGLVVKFCDRNHSHSGLWQLFKKPQLSCRWHSYSQYILISNHSKQFKVKFKCCGGCHRSWNGFYTWNRRKNVYEKLMKTPSSPQFSRFKPLQK